MADASSPCSASTSLELRSKVCAQRCRSARASISWAVIRTLSPDRITEPSMTASTLRVFAMSGVAGRPLPWNCIADPREVTRSWLIVASAGGQFIGHPFGEVVLGGIAGVVVERKDGDRSDDAGRSRRLATANSQAAMQSVTHRKDCRPARRAPRPRYRPTACAADERRR